MAGHDGTVTTQDDVLLAHPKDGPFPVGSHDPANPEGEPRTERKGEILGTPASDRTNADHIEAAREVERKRADLVTQAVDNANRFALPRLGGNAELDPAGDRQTLEDAKRTPADNAAAAAKIVKAGETAADKAKG